MITAEEVLELAPAALKNGEFIAFYQPQYNHSTGMVVGAEALVRWNSPKYGMIPPFAFIPVLEENNLIPALDLCVFEQVCKFLRKSIDENLALVRISTNLSRCDIVDPEFIDKLEAIRKQYDIPHKYVHVEITETAVIDGVDTVLNAIKKLHRLGYTVEMDDFGSGYSSLNVLKDIEFDVLKLDLKFIAGSIGSSRGGIILGSIVRMAKWLELPVIAEGVETVEQADFLKSIGCDYIQGYLYAKPMPECDYLKLLSADRVGAIVPQFDMNVAMDAGKFWNPDSLETLIFSNFVGGAAILSQQGDDKFEILRVNQKYLRELGMNLSEKEIVEMDPKELFDDENWNIYMETLARSVKSKQEEECETWRCICSDCCGKDQVCIRSSVRLIAESKVGKIYYVMIRNITNEKRHVVSLQDTERRFKAASEQANIYFWEYTVATKEMRPCFRCQRDLGLPPLLRNYPEPAIEMHIFQPDYADLYRDWHRQIAEGAKSLEAVMPLTDNRVPFHIRYTTEFDEFGRPIKAYGSATLVVNGN